MSTGAEYVSGQISRWLLDWVTARELPEAEWILDLPVRAEELRHARRPLPWKLFLTLCTRLTKLSGAAIPLEQIGRELCESRFHAATPARQSPCEDLLALYLEEIPALIAARFPGLAVEARSTHDDHVTIDRELPRRVGNATAFFRLATGALERAPLLRSQPAALVVAQIEATRASYVVRFAHAKPEAEPPSAALFDSTREQALRQLVAALPDVLCEVASDGTITYLSPSVSELLGRPPEHFLGKSFAEFLLADDAPKQLENFAKLLRSGTAKRASFQAPHADGSRRRLEASVRPFVDTDGETRIACLLREVSDSKRGEERLRGNAQEGPAHAGEQQRQSQKMEAVGRLAGGVAHDFNNLLTAIIGYADLLLEELEESPAQHDAQELLNAARRGEELTRQLLAFSRSQVLQPTRLDPNALVSRLTRKLRRLISDDIELCTQLGDDLWRVHVDASQLEQVILNLVLNSRDAMQGGGRIDIETRNRRVAGDASEEVPAGEYVLIEVSDDGPGMEKATLARIFEPFFSTKERAKGAGLGLSTAYGIIGQSGGQLRVESEVGSGTRFRIYLPRAAAEARSERRRAQLAPFRGRETILVVEDSDPVRQLVERCLKRLGYEVYVAAQWSEAKRICDTHPGPIHLLLTDLILPGVDGLEIARRAEALRPGLRVIYMSGFSGDLAASPERLGDDFILLQKPFTPSKLLHLVRQRLDAPGPTPAAGPRPS